MKPLCIGWPAVPYCAAWGRPDPMHGCRYRPGHRGHTTPLQMRRNTRKRGRMTSTCSYCGATLDNPAETVDHYDSRGRHGTPCDMRQRRNDQERALLRMIKEGTT